MTNERITGFPKYSLSGGLPAWRIKGIEEIERIDPEIDYIDFYVEAIVEKKIVVFVAEGEWRGQKLKSMGSTKDEAIAVFCDLLTAHKKSLGVSGT